jgi:hypothetical protein
MTGFVDGGRSGIFAAISTFGATATGSSTFGFGNGAGSRRASGLGVGIFATSGLARTFKGAGSSFTGGGVFTS